MTDKIIEKIEFAPQENITAAELARVLQLILPKLIERGIAPIKEAEFAALHPDVKRHFRR